MKTIRPFRWWSRDHFAYLQQRTGWVLNNIGIESPAEEVYQLSVEEADRWYDWVPAADIVELSNRVATMYWWGITPLDVADYHAAKTPGQLGEVTALQVYLWKYTGRPSQPASLQNSADSLAAKYLDSVGIEPTKDWIRTLNHHPLSHLVEYQNFGLDGEQCMVAVKQGASPSRVREWLKLMDLSRMMEMFRSSSSEIRPRQFRAMLDQCGSLDDALNIQRCVDMMGHHILTAVNLTRSVNYLLDTISSRGISSADLVSAFEVWRRMTVTMDADGVEVQLAGSSLMRHQSDGAIGDHTFITPLMKMKHDWGLDSSTWAGWIGIAMTLWARSPESQTLSPIQFTPSLRFPRRVLTEPPWADLLNGDVEEMVISGLTPELARSLYLS